MAILGFWQLLAAHKESSRDLGAVKTCYREELAVGLGDGSSENGWLVRHGGINMLWPEFVSAFLPSPPQVSQSRAGALS